MKKYEITEDLKLAIMQLLEAATFAKLSSSELNAFAKSISENKENKKSDSIIETAIKLSGMNENTILAIYQAKAEFSSLKEITDNDCDCKKKEKGEKNKK